MDVISQPASCPDIFSYMIKVLSIKFSVAMDLKLKIEEKFNGRNLYQY